MKQTTLFLVLLLGVFSCETTEPPPPPPPYVRTIELIGDVGVTETWLHVQFTDTTAPKSFTLFRNGEIILSTTILTHDTLLVDNSLTPGTQYSYKVFRTSNSSAVDSSLQVLLTTLDTTRHEFTWAIDFLGDVASRLRDVAIVSSTDIWVAGEMFLRDSIGQIDPIPYNAARWDGVQWNLLRIYFPVFCGVSTAPSSTNAVFAFGPNEVWIASGSITIMRWNGSTYTSLCIPQSVGAGTIKKIWGNSPDSVYCVGTNGTIVYYNGATWQRVETGTTAHVQDVWADEGEMLAIASNVLGFPRESSVLQIQGTSAATISDVGLPMDISGLWYVHAKRYYIVGDGIFWKGNLNEQVWNRGISHPTTFYTNSVRGTALNDVYVVGAFGEFLHFNGITWQSFKSQTGLVNGQYVAIDVKGSIAIAVGQEVPRAAVVRAVRVP